MTDRSPLENGVSRGVVEDDTLVRAHDMAENKLRHDGTGHGLIALLHDDHVAAGHGFCGDPLARHLVQLNSPRSAPACAIAVRMSASISLSSTISPDTAC